MCITYTFHWNNNERTPRNDYAIRQKTRVIGKKGLTRITQTNPTQFIQISYVTNKWKPSFVCVCVFMERVSFIIFCGDNNSGRVKNGKNPIRQSDSGIFGRINVDLTKSIRCEMIMIILSTITTSVKIEFMSLYTVLCTLCCFRSPSPHATATFPTF